MKVVSSKAARLFLAACYFFIHLSHGSSVYDRFCVRNLGCDTDFQDMILGVSLKITEKVLFNIASEVSYVYILSGQKLIKNAKNGPFWRVFWKA